MEWTDPTGLAWRVLVAYLLGAVPFGLLMCRLFKGVDLREFGSGRNLRPSRSQRAVHWATILKGAPGGGGGQGRENEDEQNKRAQPRG